MRPTGKWTILAVLLILGIGTLIVENPFSWGVTKSSRFSLHRFARVQSGMSIEEAVRLLGQPVRVVHGVSGPLCPPKTICRNFVFADDAKPWVIAYKKAWLIVDQNGRVVNALTYEEP